MAGNLIKDEDNNFKEITQLIESSRQQAYQAVNTILIDLYWKIGTQLANYLARTQPGLRGLRVLTYFV